MLLPADPIAPVRRAVIAILDELSASVRGVGTAISERDLTCAEVVLDRVRRSQPLVDRLRETVRASSEITRFAPMRWSRRGDLQHYRALADHVDNALRNTRILVRRTLVALRDRESLAAGVPDVLARLADAIDLARSELQTGDDAHEGRLALVDVAHAIGAIRGDDQGLSSHVILAQLRSAAVDLLQASGLPLEQATSALRQPSS